MFAVQFLIPNQSELSINKLGIWYSLSGIAIGVRWLEVHTMELGAPSLYIGIHRHVCQKENIVVTKTLVYLVSSFCALYLCSRKYTEFYVFFILYTPKRITSVTFTSKTPFTYVTWVIFMTIKIKTFILYDIPVTIVLMTKIVSTLKASCICISITIY